MAASEANAPEGQRGEGVNGAARLNDAFAGDSLTDAGRPTIRVGMLGCGNVGAAVARSLLTDAKRIADRTGVQLELAKVAVRSATKERDVPGVEGLAHHRRRKYCHGPVDRRRRRGHGRHLPHS